MRQILVLCAVALAAGCSGVYSPVPVGDKPTNIEDTSEEWQGTWVHPAGALYIKVMDAANGVLKVAWIDDRQGDLVLDTASVFLRDGGGWTFASIMPGGATDDTPYLWGRIEMGKRLAIFWMPDVDKFEALVREGKIPGEVEGNDVVLGRLTSSHLELIASETSGVLFDWEEPLVLMKSGE